MAEPTISLTFVEVLKEVAFFVAYGRDNTAWTVAQNDLLVDIGNAGVRQFLTPPPVGDGAPHRWSFMRPVASAVSLATDTATYTLPDDYGGGVKYFSWDDGDSNRTVPVVPIGEIEAQISMNRKTGVPEIAGIRAVTAPPGTTGQRYEVLVHPRPTASENGVNLNFTYTQSLDKWTTEGQFMPGGPMHSETIVESCLSIAEVRFNGVLGEHNQLFLTRLAASIAHDKTMSPVTGSSWPKDIDDPATGELTFDQLKREVGKALGYGWNQDAWTTPQVEEIESKVNRGYRMFLYPEVMKGQNAAHVWGFFKQEGTITLANGTGAYDLAADFAGVTGPFHY